MIEQHPVAGNHPKALADVHRGPVNIELRHAVGAARIEGCALLMRDLLHQAVELTGARLIDQGFFGEPQDQHRLQDPQRAQRIVVGGVLRAIKTHRRMALGAEVVNHIRLHLLDDPDQVGAVGEVAVVEGELRGLALLPPFVGVLVEVIHPAGIERGAAPLDPMHLVTLLQ